AHGVCLTRRDSNLLQYKWGAGRDTERNFFRCAAGRQPVATWRVRAYQKVSPALRLPVGPQGMRYIATGYKSLNSTPILPGGCRPWDRGGQRVTSGGGEKTPSLPCTPLASRCQW